MTKTNDPSQGRSRMDESGQGPQRITNKRHNSILYLKKITLITNADTVPICLWQDFTVILKSSLIPAGSNLNLTYLLCAYHTEVFIKIINTVGKSRRIQLQICTENEKSDTDLHLTSDSKNKCSTSHAALLLQLSCSLSPSWTLHIIFVLTKSLFVFLQSIVSRKKKILKDFPKIFSNLANAH